MKLIFLIVFLYLIAKAKNIAINRVTIISILMIVAVILVLSLAIYPPLFWFWIKIN